ncbi:hypothetical protein FFLO_05805 [Filobasidium floriforme]|uniref:Major facilitator superfamily (MFS) profile domain-containing protein n=1 Tax=Filobasidium floriforme TaxID=5210 RepID=A0A8K0JHX5_9TREE|nr:major facilitator superfamily domain-containing protein [Filobasidium floriforme]KAG7529043.1 hypothetical protein FFLO_05805 [Filobasidium floriforme]KAH8078684.1 major facilitator superfamily domain-containing protein [Filobasidium floriforme]
MDRKPSPEPALGTYPSALPSPLAPSASPPISSPPSPPSPKPVSPPPPSVVKETFYMSIIVILGMVNSFGAGTTLIGPKIQEDLGFGTSELQWLSTSFYIPLGTLCLISGTIADTYGGKPTCLAGMGLLTVASLGACFVRTKELLFFTRGVSGLGSALGTVAGYPMIVQIYPEGTGRTLAQAIYVAAWPTGGAFSLLASGFVAEQDWHRYFYLVTGLTGATTLAVFLFLPEPSGEAGGHSTDSEGQHARRRNWKERLRVLKNIDWIGALLSITGLVLLFYVLAVAPGAKKGWGTPYIVVLFILGFVMLGLFAIWQWYIERRESITIKPLVPLGVFALDKGRVSLLFLVAMLCFAGYAGFMFLFTLYLEVYLKLPLDKTALHFLPGPIVGITCNIVIGLIANRISPQWILTTGAISTGISLILFAVVPVGASYWTYTFFSQMLTVLGADCAGSAGLIYTTKMMTGARAGLAGGLYGTFIQLGFSLGPSVGTIGLRYIAEKNARRAGINVDGAAYDEPSFPPSSYLYGLQRASWILAALSLFAGVLVPIAMRRMAMSPDDPGDVAIDRGSASETGADDGHRASEKV